MAATSPRSPTAASSWSAAASSARPTSTARRTARRQRHARGEFGDNGTLLTDLGSDNDALFGVTVSDDGSTVYAASYKGGATDTDEQDDATLLRFTVG